MSWKRMKLEDDVLGMTDAYVHGLLTDEQVRYVDAQAAGSAVWRAALDEARDRAAAMRSLDTVEPSEALFTRSFESARLHGRRGDRTVRVFTRVIPAMFAVAAAVLLCVQVYFENLSPNGYDLTVLGQTSLAAGGPASIRVRLLDQAGGRPVAGAPVEVTLSDAAGRTVTLATFTTDSRGTGSPRYTLPDWTEGEYRLVVRAAGRETFDRTVTLKRPTRLMLSTDKPVYQPGQSIHMRTLALRRADARPMVGQEAVFTIADPKGTIIYKQRGVTSGFGISAADCPLADEIIHGAYTLTCTVAGTASQRTVDVKPYVLPKFRVNVDVSEAYLRPGQMLRMSVGAAYFFGQPVAGGAAEIEIASPDSGTLERKSVALDDQGNAALEFRVPERLVGTERDAGDARLTITATITDAGGQRESRAIARVVSARELRIEVLPESGTLIPGTTNRIYALVTTPDGRPAPGARLAITGIDREIVASELGVASFDLSPPEPVQGAPAADVSLTIAATDATGRRASRSVTLSSRVVSGDFLLRTDAASYVAGGTVALSIFGAGSEPVFVDLLKDGQTVLTQVLDIKDGRGELAIDLPTDLTGTFELAAYRFDAAGVAARRTRTIVVEGADELRVTVSPDKAQYRPGERARLQLSVTDSGGAPAPGAVSIAAVDEAVYSVLDQAPGMERTLLALDQDLLKPVYTLYPWSLDPKGGAQQRELDRALFSATAVEKTMDRKALFKQLLESGYVSEEMLEVLENPDAGRMIEDMQNSGALSAEAAAILSGKAAASVHSLSGSTWPGKVLDLKQRQYAGRQMVRTGWVLVAVMAALVVLVAIFTFAPPSVSTVVVVVIAGFMMIVILLPSLGKARSSSRRLRAQTELRGIGQALEIAGFKLAGAPGAPGSAAPRVREWFPETLLWRPEIVTDDSGHAAIEVDLADSITTWRVFGGAVTRDGRLGSLDGQIGVFQAFFVDVNVPVSLTRNDEVSVPVVVYNYLETPQRVRLGVTHADWYELLDGAEQTIELPAKGVRSMSVRIRAGRVGAHDFEVTAVTDGPEGVADAVRRTVEVLPGGTPIEHVESGSVASPLTTEFAVPVDMIEGSGRLFVKVYPSPLSQVVEGLEGIFEAPHGCFEQTSSTTYPNVLALQYLKQTGKAVPSVEATARQYIHLGYQRLLTFEVDGGGFDWFGHPPANRLLTAYGLMEFVDMAKVHDVDPALIDRTRHWLMAQRRSDGSWAAESHAISAAAVSERRPDADVVTTAYIAWAVFGKGSSGDASLTRAWLERVPVDGQTDPYVVALMVHALAGVGADPGPWMRRLMDLRQTSEEGKQSWWTRVEDSRTAFYGTGRYGDIEATALATLALIQHRGDLAAARGGIAWLTAQRTAGGTWGTTQATVLALKALMAAADAPLGEPIERALTVEVDGRVVQRVTIDANQAEVLKQVDLSNLVTPGRHRVTVRQERGPAAQAQVVFRAAVPTVANPSEQDMAPLTVDVRYDRNSLRVGEELRATATLTASGDAALPMVMLDLPIPPGFEPNRSDFDAMVSARGIARYEVTARTVIVYLTSLQPTTGLTLQYTMRATMPVSVQTPGPAAYEYYNPQRKARGPGAGIRVDPALN